MKRGVAPSSVVPWSLLAPDSTRNRTISRCPFWAAMKRGVAPSSVVPWSLLAPDSTRNRTVSKCLSWAAMIRGVHPSSVVPWSLLAPDSTRNRTISRCPCWAATIRGVHPSSVVPCSLLAPDSTRNRTVSRCPFWAAIKRGVAPVSIRPLSIAAFASSSRSTQLRLPLEAASYRGVIWFASWKFGFRGWLRCFSSNMSSFSQHATMISQSSSPGGQNFWIRSCTTPCGKISSSLSWQVPSMSASWNRGMPSSCAKRCFNDFTEEPAISSSCNSIIFWPLAAFHIYSIKIEAWRQALKNQEYHRVTQLVEISWTKFCCVASEQNIIYLRHTKSIPARHDSRAAAWFQEK